MKILALALVAACALAAAAQTSGPQAPSGAPAPAPSPTPLAAVPDEIFNRELKDLDGRSFFLSNLRGQVFVLNIWATWCGPCRFEVPELNKLHEEFAPRGVAFVGLTMEDPAKDAGGVRRYVKEFEMRYAVVWDDGETFRALSEGRSQIPQTLVVGHDGRIVTRTVGFSPDRSPAALREAIRRALGDAQ